MARRWRRALVVATLPLVLAAGCTPDPGPQPSPTPRPTSTQTPQETELERQRREDFEAAEKAYRTFRAEFNQLKIDGGASGATEVMRRNAGGDYLAAFVEIVKNYKRVGDRQEGAEKVVYVQRGGYSPTELTLEVCEDSRATKIVDDQGRTVGRGEIRTASLEVRRVDGVWKLWGGEGKKVDSCSPN